MKRPFLLLICLGSISLPVSKVDAKSSIYIQLGGSGVGISLNYEYFIRDDMPLRVGFGTILWISSIPVTLSKLTGESRHKLELGGGIGLRGKTSSAVSGIVGYRYQPEVAGAIFRLSFTPIIETVVGGGGVLVPWVGLSLGYTF